MKSFYLKQGQYTAQDKGGNVLLLDVNYQKASYKITVLKNGKPDISKLKKQISEKAQDMINRKNNTNMA